MAPYLQRKALDAVVIGRSKGNFHGGTWAGRDLALKVDAWRTVRFYLDGPTAELVLRLDHGDLAARFDVHFDLIVVRTDALEGHGGGVDAQLGQSLATDPGQQHAAPGDGQDIRRPDRAGLGQYQRRDTGIGGRRDPSFEQAGSCRGRAEFGAERAGHAAAPVAARGGQADEQAQAQNGPQPPGVAPGQAGPRPTDPESPDCAQRTLLVQTPKRAGSGIAGTTGNIVAQGGQGPVIETAGSLQAPIRRRSVGQVQNTQAQDQGPDEGRGKQGKRYGMGPTRQPAPNLQQSQHQEQKHHRQGRPQRRPQDFPKKSRPGQSLAPGHGAHHAAAQC